MIQGVVGRRRSSGRHAADVDAIVEIVAQAPLAHERLEIPMRGRDHARADGVQTRAAEMLGINERVLRYKLRKYGLGTTGSDRS